MNNTFEIPIEIVFVGVAKVRASSLEYAKMLAAAHVHAILEHSNIHVDDDDVIVDWDISTHADRVVAK